MQHPWTQFATNYAEKGIPQSSSVYPTSPVSMSYPTYNRSPAPFNMNPQQQSPSNYQQPHWQQPQQPSWQQPQQSSWQQPQQSSWQQPQWQQPQVYQEQQWQNPAQNMQDSQQSEEYYSQQHYENPQRSAPTKNPREDPDVDEDFPSYKDLRKVFVEKQNASEKPLRGQWRQPATIRSQSLPQIARKPPLGSPRPPGYGSAPNSQPLPSPPLRATQEHHAKTTRTINMMSSPKQPRRQFSQLSLGRKSENENEFNQEPPRRRSHSVSQVRSTNRYQEVPVHNVNNGQAVAWQHIKPSKEAVRYRPPNSLPMQQTDGSPMVVITSNSPRSPQKATYIPDEEVAPQQIFSPRKSFAAPPVMQRVDNEPRRRRSYAEILVTHNSLPRNFTTRSSTSEKRSTTTVNDDSNFSPHTRNRTYSTSASWQRGQATPRQPTMHQMLYSPQPVDLNIQQQNASGWPHEPVVGSGGVRTVPVHMNKHPGKSAAHLQFNSPMSLYSTQNAQQALDKDKEAAELLKYYTQTSMF